MFNELLVRGFGEGIRAALALSNARTVALEVDALTARSAIFRIAWT